MQPIHPMQPKYFGPYQVIDEIARGGMGAVYRAVHTRLGTPVAIKIMLDAADHTDVKRFKQEAQVLARLKHPNILQVVDYGITNGFPYIAMEYVEGESLKNLLKQGYRPQQALRDLMTIAESLQYCHDLGIIHRDLKPDNIVVEAGTQRPVLIDFGLVKRDKEQMGLSSIDRSRLSMTGEIKGTPQFMAPEQLDPTLGHEGPACDIYALGGILFNILTGRTPFEGTSVLALYVKKMKEDAPDPREFNPEINPLLAELCNSCLAIDQADRPVSAELFAELLRDATQKRVPRSRKRKFIPTLIAGGLLTSGVGLGGYLMSQDRDPHFSLEASATPRQKRLPARVGPSVTPTPTLVPEAPQVSVAPMPAVENLDTLIEDFDAAYESDNLTEMMELANTMIDHYPSFYRSYLYRATAYVALMEVTRDRTQLIQYKEQAIADYDRAIRLTTNPQEKLRLSSIKQRLLRIR